MAEPTVSPQKKRYKYKAEMKQLLHLIVHSLYTHKEIFLRELISNASDALNKARFRGLTDKNMLSKDQPLQIKISADLDNKKLIIEDTGIGMTEEDLNKRLGTIASSGTRAFLEQMKDTNKPADGNMIGQFGVGFYAVFMVADEVTVETRFAEADSKGFRWVSNGEGSFTIQEIDKPERGTRIILSLKEDADEFARDYRVKQIIQKYSNFVDFPIYLEEEQVNTVKALWHKSKSDITDEDLEEFYKFISNDYTAPLGHLHLQLEGRVNFKSLMFIPKKAPPSLFRDAEQKTLHLYANNVFIQEDCKELLPDYLRFVQGVVDTEDLPLNVSREVTQNSPVMAKIKQILTGKILGLLENWATKDEEKFDTFFSEFGTLFKVGLNSDYTNREKIIELLRFETTRTEAGQLTSLAEYVQRMPEEQKEIYYLVGEHREALLRNPNLEYFRKKDIEVLLLSDPVDPFTITSVFEYGEKQLKSIEKADIDLESSDEAEENKLDETVQEGLIERFKSVLGDRVEDVIPSRRLVDSPATLVVGDKGMDTQMERMMRMMDQQFKPSAKILEINLGHPLLKNIASLMEANAEDPRINQTALQLLEGALLMDGNLEQTGDFIARMNELMVRATEG